MILLLIQILTITSFASGKGGDCSISEVLKKVIPVSSIDSQSELLSQIDENLNFARIALLENNLEKMPELSKKLVELQEKVLVQKGIPIYVDPEKRWIDILPDPKGKAINRLSDEVANRSQLKEILRYQPEMLFDDAYSAYDTGFLMRNKVIYLSHRDVLGVSKSNFLKEQIDFSHSINSLLEQSAKREENFMKPEPTVAKDHAVDWWRHRDVYTGVPMPPRNAEERTRELIDSYLKKTKELVLIQNKNDPLVMKISPYKLMGRGRYDHLIPDIRGGGYKIYNIDDIRVTEISAPIPNAESTSYDLYLQNSIRDLHMKRDFKYRRALVMPNGRTLSQLAGTDENQKYFQSYLNFLKRIYTDPKGLALDSKVFEGLRKKSMELIPQSELITWTKSKRWLSGTNSKDISGGMILVKSEHSEQLLPIQFAHPNVIIRKSEDEVLIEMGRLGSLSPDETINFLKIAGVGLFYKHPGKTIRIVCEANPLRARLFNRFGFKEAATKLTDKSYYKGTPDIVMETTLEDFLAATLR